MVDGDARTYLYIFFTVYRSLFTIHYYIMPMETRIKLGISTCLLGENVRYDGGHKLDHFLADILGQYVDYIPVCPEVECGLGTPRESLRLEGNPVGPRLVTIQTHIDHTDRIIKWARKRVRDLEKENLRIQHA